MFAGHVGAALAIGRAERRVNVGAFVFAALLLDVVLWLFVLVGWESVIIPANFTATHQPQFVFPYSHGLLASVAWAVLAAAMAFLLCSRVPAARGRVAVLIAAAVLSHWLLDALVHVPELPLAGASSIHLGLGLWQSMPVALVTEALIVVAGLYLFVPGAILSRGRTLWLTVLSFVILAFTVAGMTAAPPPPSVTMMAASSLATISVVCALACWFGKLPK